MFRHLVLAAAVLLPALLPGASILSADTVQTRNGTELSGTVVSIQDGDLLMAPAEGKSASFALSELSQVRTEQEMLFHLDNSDRLTGRILSLQEGCFLLESEPLGKMPLPLQAIDRAAPVGEKDETAPEGGTDGGERQSQAAAGQEPGYELSGRINAGWNKATGNTESQSLHVDGDFSARKLKNRYKLRGELNRAQEDGEETSNNWSFLAGYDRFLSQRLYFNANLQLDRDRLQDLDLRSSFGAGPGYQFLDTERTSLAVEAGANYVIEDYSDQETERFAAGRFATDFGWWIIPEAIELFHSHVGLISLERGDDILITTATGLRLPLREHFNLSLQYELDWDNVPSEGNERIDERYTLTLGYDYL
jgi:putative salt-induced outer membrane protein YdiY